MVIITVLNMKRILIEVLTIRNILIIYNLRECKLLGDTVLKMLIILNVQVILRRVYYYIVSPKYCANMFKCERIGILPILVELKCMSLS